MIDQIVKGSIEMDADESDSDAETIDEDLGIVDIQLSS